MKKKNLYLTIIELSNKIIDYIRRQSAGEERIR